MSPRREQLEAGDLVQVKNMGYGRVIDHAPEGTQRYTVEVFGDEYPAPCVVAAMDMTIKVKKNEWLTA